MHDMPIAHGKDGIMPGALDTAIEELALFQRPAGVRADGANGLDEITFAIEQHRMTCNLDPAWFTLSDLGEL